MKKTIYLLLILIATVSICGCNNEKKNTLKENNLKGSVKYVEEKTYSTKEKFGEIEKDRLENYSLVSFNKDGNIINYTSDYKLLYKYDSKGNVIEMNKYNSDGSLEDKYKFKYDSKVNVIEMNKYNSDGSLEDKYKFKYDSKGNMIEKSDYNSDGSLKIKWTFKYDSKGNVIEQYDYNSDGSLQQKYKFKYDSKGNVIEMNNYNSDGNLDIKWTFVYEYDSKDNWIKKIVKDNDGKALNIIERKIVYFGDDDENNYPEWDSPSYKGINIQNESGIDVSTETEIQTETPTITPVY